LRPTRPIFSPGVKVTDALSSTTLTPRRSVTLRTEIIRSNFGRDRHDSRPDAQGGLFSGRTSEEPPALPGVRQIRTFMVLKQVFSSTQIAI
jgi:hypothetical protein